MAFVALLLVAIALQIVNANKIPLIIDTDFGNAMDDTFAVAFALRNRNIFNITLISTASFNTTGRAMLLSSFLTKTGYDNIDIGIGIEECTNASIEREHYPYPFLHCVGAIWPWLDTSHIIDPLSKYEGRIYSNGVERMIELIKEYSPSNPIYILAIGPLTNIAAVFIEYPELRRNVRLFIMAGSLYRDSAPFGWFAEFNIVQNVTAASIVYNGRGGNSSSMQPIVDVTWDTGYYFQINGEAYQQLLHSNDVLAKIIIEMYIIQYENGGKDLDKGSVFDPLSATPALYDLEIMWLLSYVAERMINGDSFEVIMNGNIPYLEMERQRIGINESGFMVPNESLNSVYFVSEWKINGMEKISELVVADLTRDDESTHDEFGFILAEVVFGCGVLGFLTFLYQHWGGRRGYMKV